MIIIINGALGVGKSTVSQALAQRFTQSALIDGDALADVHPFAIHDPQRLELWYSSASLLCKEYLAHGYDPVILNYVFESPEELAKIKSNLMGFEVNIPCFWLSASVETLENRIKSRRREEVEWELQRGPELQKILDKASTRGFIGTRIETDDLSVKQIANHIFSQKIQT